MKTHSFPARLKLAVGCLAAAFSAFMLLSLPAAAAEKPKADVLIVVGPSNHPPGSHEVAAGGRLLQHCLEHAANVSGIRAPIFYEWPSDAALLQKASTLVLIGDHFPPERLNDPARIRKDLTAMMSRGCGLVCIHYATGLTAKDVSETGDHPLLQWMGGYFATGCKHHKSVARVFTSTITPAEVRHPVLRGWRAFTLEDEPYYNNYFGPNGLEKNVTALATAMVPPEAPKREVIAWAVERPDGGRGMGIVMPHFYRNWKAEDLRKFILNGIVWTAKREVPADGVRTDSPDLAAFQPTSVEPKPAPAKPATAKP